MGLIAGAPAGGDASASDESGVCESSDPNIPNSAVVPDAPEESDAWPKS